MILSVLPESMARFLLDTPWPFSKDCSELVLMLDGKPSGSSFLAGDMVSEIVGQGSTPMIAGAGAG